MLTVGAPSNYKVTGSNGEPERMATGRPLYGSDIWAEMGTNEEICGAKTLRSS